MLDKVYLFFYQLGLQFNQWLAARLRPLNEEPERGDVPGWVMITLMTAGLVFALWTIAGDALKGLFNSAISKVAGLK